ncbi:hypothetical protein GQ600_12430 [Phytophthora cactorum]|nr:hypothetical protein GQ600_12430 [Phytophthora cactorum]
MGKWMTIDNKRNLIQQSYIKPEMTQTQLADGLAERSACERHPPATLSRNQMKEDLSCLARVGLSLATNRIVEYVVRSYGITAVLFFSANQHILGCSSAKIVQLTTQTVAICFVANMPAKAVLSAAPSPFKGESFPQYVLCRSNRSSKAQCITDTTNIQVPTATPLPTQPPTAFLTASTPKQEPAPRRARLASTGAQAITAQLASTYNLSIAPALTASSSSGQVDPLGKDKVAFQATTIGLSVGKLECRFPCPATFSSDRCTYLFQHPFEAKEVLMIMYYETCCTHPSTRQTRASGSAYRECWSSSEDI